MRKILKGITATLASAAFVVMPIHAADCLGELKSGKGGVGQGEVWCCCCCQFPYKVCEVYLVLADSDHGRLIMEISSDGTEGICSGNGVIPKM